MTCYLLFKINDSEHTNSECTCRGRLHISMERLGLQVGKEYSHACATVRVWTAMADTVGNTIFNSDLCLSGHMKEGKRTTTKGRRNVRKWYEAKAAASSTSKNQFLHKPKFKNTLDLPIWKVFISLWVWPKVFMLSATIKWRDVSFVEHPK